MCVNFFSLWFTWLLRHEAKHCSPLTMAFFQLLIPICREENFSFKKLQSASGPTVVTRASFPFNAAERLPLLLFSFLCIYKEYYVRNKHCHEKIELFSSFEL